MEYKKGYRKQIPKVLSKISLAGPEVGQIFVRERDEVNNFAALTAINDGGQTAGDRCATFIVVWFLVPRVLAISSREKCVPSFACIHSTKCPAASPRVFA